jgi:hypothetical protein
VAAALGLGLIGAVSLAASVQLVEAVATEAGLRATLRSLGDGGMVTVEQFNTRDAAAFEGFQREAGGRVQAAVGPHLQAGAQFATIGPYFPASLNGQTVTYDAGDPLPTLAYYRDLARHVRVLAGQMPTDAGSLAGEFPASLSQAAVEIFKLKLGDRYCISFGRNSALQLTIPAVCTRIAAIWQARNPRDPFWGGSPPGLQLVLSRDDFYSPDNQRFARTGPVAGRYYAPDLESINAQNAASLAQALNRLRGYFTVRREGFFTTSIDTSIKGFLDRERVASFTVQLVAAGLLLVTLYSVAFLARLFLEAQSRQLAVLRARGWRRRQVWTLLMAQLGALAALAVPLGLLLAALVTAAVSITVFGASAPRLSWADFASVAPALAATLLAGLLLLAALAAGAARRDVLELLRSASRPQDRPWWRWRHLDLVLALLAVPLLAESRLRGSGQVRDVAAADDPLSLLFPALALAFLAIACLRLLPLISTLGGRLGRGVAASLAGWQLARRPAQHASLALLLTFAVALGVFSTVYSSTERRNTLDRAAYRAGTDVRVTYTINQQPPRFDTLLSSLNGVVRSSAAYRATGSPGATVVESTVLGIDPATFTGAAWSREDLNGEPMSRLVDRLARKDPDGLYLPGRASALSVWVYSTGLDAHLVAEVGDDAGRVCACDLGSLDYVGWRHLGTPFRFSGPGPASYPLRLKSLVMRQSVSGRSSGQIALSDLAADDRVIEHLDSAKGWWLGTLGTSAQVQDLTASSSRPRDDGRATMSVDLHLERGDLVLRPPASSQPLPALLSSAALQTLGVGLNQPFPIHIDSYRVDVTAIGMIDYFPSLYSGQEQFLIIPRDSLLGRLQHEGSASAWPNELWLKLSGESPSPSLTDKLRSVGPVLELEDRRQIQAAALSDPLRVALDATLVVGFLAALTMTVVGFGLHFLMAARVRLGEYAILRANGLSAAVVGRSLAIEQGVLLGYGMITGAALGVIVAFAVLPAVQLGSDPGDYVPPTVVTVDPIRLTLAAGVVVLGGLLVGWLARLASSRFRLLDELRQLG